MQKGGAPCCRADVSQVKAQYIPLEKYVWRNMNLRSMNMRIDFGMEEFN